MTQGTYMCGSEHRTNGLPRSNSGWGEAHAGGADSEGEAGGQADESADMVGGRVTLAEVEAPLGTPMSSGDSVGDGDGGRGCWKLK